MLQRTKKKPTKVGWYWKWGPNYSHDLSEIVYVRDYVGKLCIMNWEIPKDVYWAGPIPEPKK